MAAFILPPALLDSSGLAVNDVRLYVERAGQEDADYFGSSAVPSQAAYETYSCRVYAVNEAAVAVKFAHPMDLTDSRRRMWRYVGDAPFPTDKHTVSTQDAVVVPAYTIGCLWDDFTDWLLERRDSISAGVDAYELKRKAERLRAELFLHPEHNKPAIEVDAAAFIADAEELSTLRANAARVDEVLAEVERLEEIESAYVVLTSGLAERQAS